MLQHTDEVDHDSEHDAVLSSISQQEQLNEIVDKVPPRPTAHSCGIVCKNQHGCLGATVRTESTVLRVRLVILKSNTRSKDTEIYMVRELKGGKYIFPQADSDLNMETPNTDTGGFEDLAITLAEDKLNLDIDRAQLHQLHYERTVKRVSTVRTKVRVLTFVIGLTREQVMTIHEGHITTHGKSTPVNDLNRPYDLHLFRSTKWFDAFKNDDGVSANVRITESILRTCAEAIALVEEQSIDINTDATNYHIELQSNNDWPMIARFSDVVRVLLPPADGALEVVDLTSDEVDRDVPLQDHAKNNERKRSAANDQWPLISGHRSAAIDQRPLIGGH